MQDWGFGTCLWHELMCSLVLRSCKLPAPTPAHPALPLPLPCSMLAALTSDPRNIVYIISGRARTELADWFGSVVSDAGGSWAWGCACCSNGTLSQRSALVLALFLLLFREHEPHHLHKGLTSYPSACPRQEGVGLAAEHGFYWRPNARSEWQVQDPEARFGWKDIVGPILQVGGWTVLVVHVVQDMVM